MAEYPTREHPTSSGATPGGRVERASVPPEGAEPSATVIDIAPTDLRSFFHAPETSPLDGPEIDRPGMEQLADAVTAHRDWRRRAFRLRLHVPSDAPDLARAPHLPAALARHCDLRLAEADRALRQTRREGLRTLAVGLVFLTACVGIAALIETMPISERLFGRMLMEGSIIAGWVGLWRPLEILLFDWWAPLRERALYQRLRTLPIEIVT